MSKTFHQALSDLAQSYRDQGTAWVEIEQSLFQHADKVQNQIRPAEEADKQAADNNPNDPTPSANPPISSAPAK